MIKNGIYTIRFTKSGDHRTLRVKTVRQGKLQGKRILELLTGPDNESSYTAFAFVEDDHVMVWKSKRAPAKPRGYFEGSYWSPLYSKWQKAAAVFTDLVLRGQGGYWKSYCELMLSANCRRCNRTLTTPESIEAGIGPECAQR